MIAFTVGESSQEIRALLRRIQQGMRNMRPVMDSIGQELVSRISGRFETESDPLGQSWEPWAPSTRETYPDNGNGRLLDRYGDMLGSLNFSADADSVRVGFGNAVAVFHEWGTWKKPRRGMLFADPDTDELGAGMRGRCSKSYPSGWTTSARFASVTASQCGRSD